jgi:hypothetical protein
VPVINGEVACNAPASIQGSNAPSRLMLQKLG